MIGDTLSGSPEENTEVAQKESCEWGISHAVCFRVLYKPFSKARSTKSEFHEPKLQIKFNGQTLLNAQPLDLTCRVGRSGLLGTSSGRPESRRMSRRSA